MNRLLLASPVGPLLAEYNAEGLHGVRFWPHDEHPPAGVRDAPARGDELGRCVTAQLAEYFAGGRRIFDLPLVAKGTPFQQRVWAALAAIPWGETRSYAQVAVEAGSPSASRAVGQANGRNPLPIVVPCHRVLAAGGGIGGYMGAGPEGTGVQIKRWLLRHEGAAP